MKATVSALIVRYNGQPVQVVGFNGDAYEYCQFFLTKQVHDSLDDTTLCALKKNFGDSHYLGEEPIICFIGTYGGVTIGVEDFVIEVE